MRVIFLSRYGRLGASSRLRCFQYIPYFESRGVVITIAPLLSDDYIAGIYNGRIPLASVVRSYYCRWQWMLKLSDFDVVWVEKEMLPWVPAWLELGCLPREIPMVVDYDDAVFHRYDLHRFKVIRAILGHKIDAVMRRADLVVAGNHYLADRALHVGARRVEVLPTVVDLQRYSSIQLSDSPPVTIGWMGSPATAHYLLEMAPVFEALLAQQNIRLVAVGANKNQLGALPFNVMPWTEASEVTLLQHFHIGIMPLPDEPFERGKCGYKLIQYMACAKPVVASPIGVNSIIVRHGVDGFLASSTKEWIEYLQLLIVNSGLRYQMGQAGRARVEAEYSLQVTAPKLERLLHSVII